MNTPLPSSRGGPLAGLKVLALGGIGPVPYCAMLLADLGADVVRIDRPQSAADSENDPLATPVDVFSRGQRSIFLDLKSEQGRTSVLALAETLDVLIEGFRPGVAERLGLGPVECEACNPRLVYGRVTGWGREGPLAQAPGHDINYIALTGALHSIGRAGEPPVLPLNLIGDFAGGGLQLAFGVLAALYERDRSGRGQVVDAAMIDGAASFMTMAYGLQAFGKWQGPRGTRLLDGGAHFMDSYECADGGHIALGAIEPPFYAELLKRCGIDDPLFQAQLDATQWPELKHRLAALLRTRTRAEWCALLEGSAACASPVLSIEEAPTHPHHAARGSFVQIDGVTLPSPMPRFGRTPAHAPGAFARPGEHTHQVLATLATPSNLPEKTI